MNGTGNILEASRGSGDIEFRVEGTGNVYCDGSFSGGGADYAEWLERADPDEAMGPGDVVGVTSGRIALDTAGAQQVLVISTDPVLVGNADGAESSTRAGHERAAFLGQVPVRVRGPVAAGDFLVASGRGDGTAVAVAPAELASRHLGRLVGTAWANAAGAGEHRVLAAVGIDQAAASARVIANLERALQDRMEVREAAIGALEERL
jgi:hypothetical protein